MDPLGLECHHRSSGRPVEGGARFGPKDDLTLVDHEHHRHDCREGASAYRDMAQSAADQPAQALDCTQHLMPFVVDLHPDDDHLPHAEPAGPKVLSSVL
jgi:hypothetical protein